MLLIPRTRISGGTWQGGRGHPPDVGSGGAAWAGSPGAPSRFRVLLSARFLVLPRGCAEAHSSETSFIATAGAWCGDLRGWLQPAWAASQRGDHGCPRLLHSGWFPQSGHPRASRVVGWRAGYAARHLTTQPQKSQNALLPDCPSGRSARQAPLLVGGGGAQDWCIPWPCDREQPRRLSGAGWRRDLTHRGSPIGRNPSWG